MKRENRGGLRDPVGGRPRKKVDYSEQTKRRYRRAVRYFQRLVLGESPKMPPITPEMIDVGMIYRKQWDEEHQKWVTSNVQDSVQASALNRYQNVAVIKESRKSVETFEKPWIGLPPLRGQEEETKETESQIKH
jgi:hypothetical protein